MIKSKSICSKCRKIRGVSCICPKKKAFQGISHENQSFYNSTRWRKLSKEFKKQNPLCIRCLQDGRTSEAYYTDHIIPIRKGGDKWALSNLQPLCKKCHAIKSGEDNKK